MKHKSTFICKTCEQGSLIKRKKYRMSGPVVLIGYILLIPSIIGIGIGVFILLATGSVVGVRTVEEKEAIRSELVTAKIPASVTTEIVDKGFVDSDINEKLSDSQRQIVESIMMQKDDRKVNTVIGAVAGGGVGIFLIISAFVGGLLGRLLTMKKRILQCNSCETVIAAS